MQTEKTGDWLTKNIDIFQDGNFFVARVSFQHTEESEVVSFKKTFNNRDNAAKYIAQKCNYFCVIDFKVEALEV